MQRERHLMLVMDGSFELDHRGRKLEGSRQMLRGRGLCGLQIRPPQEDTGQVGA
jgi:hypothetical protein